jgi:hypothetical protein
MNKIVKARLILTKLILHLFQTLPDEFVQEHGDEASGNVILDAARTAGQVLAVEFVKEEDAETGELKSIRIGQGWESFVVRNQLQAPDLLFFTLQGPSRFIVMMIRGHTRHATAEDPAPRKHKLDTADDLEESTAELWHAAKKRKRGPAPEHDPNNNNNNNDDDDESDSAIFVTCISSEDTLGSYRLLSDGETSGASGDGSDVDDEDCSDFEDEFEFRRTRHLVS